MTTHTTKTCACPACRPVPSQISFAAECFEPTDERVTTYVVLRSALHPNPAEFSDRTTAEAYARRLGRSVEVRSTPKLRRVRWSA